MVDAASIKKIIKSSFNNIISKSAYGETTFFYNPMMRLPSGVYFTTLKEADGPRDRSSNLSREGVFRLSFKPLISTYKDLFGKRPHRPRKGEVVDLDLDFAELNTFLPHPIYAWMGWMMILNPSDSNLESVIKLLNESYGQARDKFEKRMK
jgi:hypothetical protein